MKMDNSSNSIIMDLPRYPQFCDITGEVYGRVEAMRYAGVQLSPKGKRTSMWVCRCLCDKEFTTSGNNLKRGNTKTCGCSRGSHKMSDSPEWEAWSAITQRCTNPKNPGFRNYGGRGISVCKRWRQFENFFVDMGVRPEGYSIDRTNNEGNYEPSNCKWVLNRLQHRNKRSNRMITLKGETRCISEWSEIIGVSPNGLSKRIKKGWSEDQIMSPPDTSCYNKRKKSFTYQETSRSHLAHVIANACILMDAAKHGTLVDDRP